MSCFIHNAQTEKRRFRSLQCNRCCTLQLCFHSPENNNYISSAFGQRIRINFALVRTNTLVFCELSNRATFLCRNTHVTVYTLDLKLYPYPAHSTAYVTRGKLKKR